MCWKTVRRAAREALAEDFATLDRQEELIATEKFMADLGVLITKHQRRMGIRTVRARERGDNDIQVLRHHCEVIGLDPPRRFGTALDNMMLGRCWRAICKAYHPDVSKLPNPNERWLEVLESYRWLKNYQMEMSR